MRTPGLMLAGLLVAALVPSTAVGRGPPAKFSLAPSDAPGTMEGLQFLCLVPAACPMKSDQYDLLKQALKGDLYSQYMIGLDLIEGDGVPMDGKAGRQWIVLAAEAGYPAAVRYVERQLQNGEDIQVDETKMANELKKQVEKGSTAAMRALGPMMIRGRGTAQDPEGGIALLLKAAEGSTRGDAEYEIGDLYLLGTNGLKSDRGEAMKWYAKAASRGNVRAMSVLSDLWENEPTVINGPELLKQAQRGEPLHIPEQKYKRNVVQSYCWRMRAALMDDGIAQYQMALTRSRRDDDSFGNVIEADIPEADFWFRLGARNPEHNNSQVRADLEPKMTTAQLEEVKKRVAAWKALDFQGMKAAQIPIPGTSGTCDPMP